MGQTCETQNTTIQEGVFPPCGAECDSEVVRARGCFGGEAKQASFEDDATLYNDAFNELQNMKLGPLQRRAFNVGATQEEVDAALEKPTQRDLREAFISLIASKEVSIFPLLAQEAAVSPMPAAISVSPETDTGEYRSPKRDLAFYSQSMQESRKSPVSRLQDAKDLLAAALQESRYCAAEREFNRLVQTQKLDPESQVSKRSFQIEDVEIERFMRISRTTEKALKMSLDMLPSNFDISEKNLSLNLWWGLRVIGERMQGTFSCTVPLNILECCVVEFERDLENVHCLEEVTAEFLKGLPDDAIWRRQSVDKETGSLSDDVEIVSVCDALDEHGCIMRMKYLPEDSKFPYGVAISDYIPEKNGPRSDGHCSFVKLVPTVQGTEVHSVFEVSLPSAVATKFRTAPSSVLKKGSRKAYENWVASVVPWANSKQGKAEITKRLTRVPLARVYKNLAFHVFRHDAGHVQRFPFPKQDDLHQYHTN